MTPAELSRTVLRAVRRAVDDGELDAAVCAAGEERIVVERPRAGGQGDYATNVALQLARPAGRPPRQVAEILSRRLGESPGIDGVVVTGPGFLNVRLSESASASASGALVAEILSAGERYGFAESATGQVVQLHAPDEVRALVVMDSVARLLRSQGGVVRTSCAGRPRPEWVDVLGVHVDAVGSPDGGIGVRPVPAPADPLPLGRDAARWALLHPAGHDRPRIGDDEHEHLAQRESNPLFRVRYAHARTHALTRNAADLGFTGDPTGRTEDVPGHEDLVAALADHPRILRASAAQHAPDRLARHLVGVADTFMASLCPAVLPQGEEKPSAAHRSRLALAEAVGTVLAGGLTLLGIDVPEHL
ncbi:ArgS-related anticodon-binding protein NrtL [Streptomyces sp. NPDC102384]|uniref:ArgS-related anticodon-binding protein NrtL n=1 Tax=Streptomyces sp. NPDC102384 TaxID=3366166 RepID=UPI003828B1B7